MVDEATVESVLQEINQLDEASGNRIVEELGQKQPDLFAFVIAFSERFSPDASGLAIYLFIAIYRMFEKTHGSIRRIRPGRIERGYDQTTKAIRSLEQTAESFLDSPATTLGGDEPWVTKYVLDAIFEDADPDHEIPEDDQGRMFLLLHTVIDLLHDPKKE
ncbi:MAG: hypothetical protein WBX15_02450 [Thermoanaerobaculia bacterium]